MSVYQRGETWWYSFIFAGQRIQETAKTQSKTVAKDAEKRRRRDLELGFNNIGEDRNERVQTVQQAGTAYLEEYKVRSPRSATFAEYATRHVIEHLGAKMLVDLDCKAVEVYQTARLKEGAAPKTVNEEVGFLLRVLEVRGDAIRVKMRREKTLKLKVRVTTGKAFDLKQKEDLLKVAAALSPGTLPSGEKRTRKSLGTRSPFIKPALALAFNAGMRSKEFRELTWGQIDFEKKFLTVGKSKTDAGEGRTIPLSSDLLVALTEHARWYTQRFGIAKPEWYIFPGRVGKPVTGNQRPYDPTIPVTTLKTSWKNVKRQAGVNGRLHDARHTLITELAESGAGDQTIMDIAGHVSRQMLARYSHIRMEAKRTALEVVGAKKSPTAVGAGEQDKEPAIIAILQ
jgi:integrase